MNYGDLSPEKKRKIIESVRRWQAKNPDKVRETHKRANAAWRKRNPDKVREMGRSYERANAEARRAKTRASYAKNREKRVVNAVAWAKANPERAKRNADRARWRGYGLDPLEVEARLSAHDGRCECCGADKPGGRWGWNVDHDHARGKVRGILCHNCNTAIGKLGDTLDGVLRAVAYLEKGKA